MVRGPESVAPMPTAASTTVSVVHDAMIRSMHALASVTTSRRFDSPETMSSYLQGSCTTTMGRRRGGGRQSVSLADEHFDFDRSDAIRTLNSCLKGESINQTETVFDE
jgi:hypothetical protein